MFQDGWRPTRREGRSTPRRGGRRAHGQPTPRRDQVSPSALGHRSSTAISYTLHSLPRVLFNLPSRYLSSIGLVHVFSLGWNSPPALGCDPKQPDSLAGGQTMRHSRGERGSHPLRRRLPASLTPRGRSARRANHNSRSAISGLGSTLFARRYSGYPCWFLFLRLLICLTSAGSLAGVRVHDDVQPENVIPGTGAACGARARGRPPCPSGRPGAWPGRPGGAPNLGAPRRVFGEPDTDVPSTCVSGAFALGERMTHETLQFATRIALRGVLHRGTSRVIHRCRYQLRRQNGHGRRRPRASGCANGAGRAAPWKTCIKTQQLVLRMIPPLVPQRRPCYDF